METQTKICTFSSDQLQPEKTTSTILNQSRVGKAHEIRVNHTIEEEHVVTGDGSRWYGGTINLKIYNVISAHLRRIKFFAFCCPLILFLLIILTILVLSGVINLH